MLQDLAQYSKFREKAAAAAARSLVALFREIAPGMLEKKDRGRGADMSAVPLAYGHSEGLDRVPGAHLLEQVCFCGVFGWLHQTSLAMMEKKDRGRGADVSAVPLAYGQSKGWIGSLAPTCLVEQVCLCSFPLCASMSHRDWNAGTERGPRS